MLADIRPLLTEQVYHHYVWGRDIYGSDSHYRMPEAVPARLVYTDGRQTGATSGEKVADAKATLWLLNHHHPIIIGDRFELPSGETLKVIGCERRIAESDTIYKVHLS